MDDQTVAALFDELEKIAAKKRVVVQEDLGRPAREANNLFGLPYAPPPEKPRRGVRQYQEPNAGAMSADRSQDPIGAQSTANLSQGGAMYPMSGPGGV